MICESGIVSPVAMRCVFAHQSDEPPVAIQQPLDGGGRVGGAIDDDGPEGIVAIDEVHEVLPAAGEGVGFGRGGAMRGLATE